MSADLSLPVVILPHGEGLQLPSYQTPLSAGMDLRAAIAEDLVLLPNQPTLVPTGLSMAIPRGYEGQVRPRSGLALRNGISIPNSPGTIDADYRGELKVILINLTSQNFIVTRGMRIAQLVIAPVVQAHLEVVSSLSETQRGSGGFGSTGKNS